MRDIDYEAQPQQAEQAPFSKDEFTAMDYVKLPGLYRNCLINKASLIKKGDVAASGFEYQWDQLKVALVWPCMVKGVQKHYKISVGVSAYRKDGELSDRVYELCGLCGSLDSSGEPVLQYEEVEGNYGVFRPCSGLVGKKVDVVLDEVSINDKGFLSAKVKGFFKDNLSLGELTHDVKPQNGTDIYVCFDNLNQQDKTPYKQLTEWEKAEKQKSAAPAPEIKKPIKNPKTEIARQTNAQAAFIQAAMASAPATEEEEDIPF